MNGTASIEGKLQFCLPVADGPVTIQSTRPLAAARMFVNRSIDETLKMLPLLFNVCGQAQAVASIRAIESASGRIACNDVERERERLCQLETLREHLWRVLFEWPTFCGQKPEPLTAAHIMSLLQKLRTALDPDQRLCNTPGLNATTATATERKRLADSLQDALTTAVFGMPPADWLQQSPERFDAWVATYQTPATQMLARITGDGLAEVGVSRIAPIPALDASTLHTALTGADVAAFIASPTWNGQPAETGVTVRQLDHPLVGMLEREHGRGLLVRMVARLVEIANLTQQLADPAPGFTALPGRPGLSQVEAARGRLCHHVELEGRRLMHYAILAPTEWNFHPLGTAQQALRDVAARDPADREFLARLLIHAIDPCVGFDLQLEAA